MGARFQYQGLADPLQEIAVDTTQRPAGGGVGLLYPKLLHQYQALTGPVLVPAPAVVPEITPSLYDVPTRRRVDLRATQSTEYGRADPPPPPVPDLAGSFQPDPTRRRFLQIGLVHQQVVLPPGYPADWYPSAEYQIRRRRFLTAEGFAAPPDRPVVPFDPAQGVAILPQPPLRPAARRYYAALTVYPAGPPSSALTPPGTLDWQGLANQPPAGARPRQGLTSAPQNLDPIPQPDPPEGSWYPCAVLPPDVFKRRPQLEAFAFNPEPIDTPALLSSFWTGLYPPGPFAKIGLRTDLQQPFADAPPIIEVTVVSGAWRPEAPALLLRRARLVAEAFAAPQSMTTLADAYGCMTLAQVQVTQPTMLAVAVEGATLLSVTVSHATMIHVEVC